MPIISASSFVASEIMLLVTMPMPPVSAISMPLKLRKLEGPADEKL